MSTMYEQIEFLCYQNGTNITNMCKKLNISRSVLSELRSGRTKELSVHNLRKIADYFHISVDSLSHCSESENFESFIADEYFTQLYQAAKELNDENRKKLLDLAKMFWLAQQAELSEPAQLSFL